MPSLDNLTALFDVIRQNNLSFSENLAKDNPELANVIMGRRILGENSDEKTRLGSSSDSPADTATRTPSDKSELYLAIAGESAIAAKASVKQISSVLTRKTRMLALVRLLGGILTSSSLAVLLGAVVSENRALELTTAIIALSASLLVLISSFIESYSGGEGSIARAKEDLILIVDKLAQANSAYAVAKVRNSSHKAFESLELFNEVAAKCLTTGSRIGISLDA